MPHSGTLRGYFPIMPTAFYDDGTVDLESMRRLTRFLVESGAQGMSPNGGDSECRHLMPDERKRITAVVVEEAAGRRPVLVGTSAQTTEISVDLSRDAGRAGADAVFVTPPGAMFGRQDFSDDEMFAHYAAIADATDIPLMIHATANMTVAFIERLITHIPTVRYIKEETSHGPKLSTYLDALGDRIILFGPGHRYTEELSRGVQGVMPSVLGPRTHARVFDLWQAGDRAGAREQWHRLLPLVHWRWTGGGMEAGKEYLKHLGIFETTYTRQTDGRCIVDDAGRRELLDILVWLGDPL